MICASGKERASPPRGKSRIRQLGSGKSWGVRVSDGAGGAKDYSKVGQKCGGLGWEAELVLGESLQDASQSQSGKFGPDAGLKQVINDDL